MNSERSTVCLVGRDYGVFGRLEVVAVSDQTAAAISVGSDESSPSSQFKTDAACANEDTLCVVEANEFSVFAVADAHYGPESSHTLIERLHSSLLDSGVPAELHDLSHLLDALQEGPPPSSRSETTFLVVVYNRELKSGFGISFGDSSFVVSSPGTATGPLNLRNARYVSTSPDQLPLEGAAFNFSARPGDVLLTYTDGIDECHYRSPSTSVTQNHIAGITAADSLNPQAVARGLGQLALAGVDGNPGGQDNIALIVSLA